MFGLQSSIVIGSSTELVATDQIIVMSIDLNHISKERVPMKKLVQVFSASLYFILGVLAVDLIFLGRHVYNPVHPFNWGITVLFNIFVIALNIFYLRFRRRI